MMYWKFGCDVIRPDLILEDRRGRSFERTLRPSGACEIAIIVVELLHPLRDMCVAECRTELIIGTFFAEADELDAGVARA
jgi:hypothetical protein